MQPAWTPLRSALYVPASNPSAMAKAETLRPDATIFDLEDSVAPQRKAAARAALEAALAGPRQDRRRRAVRINALSAEGREDAVCTRGLDCDAIVLPKAAAAEDIDALAEIVGDRPIWALIETPAGVVNAAGIAAHPATAALIVGTNDLARDLGVRDRAERMPIMVALQTCVLAARAHRVPCLDGVYNAYRDSAGFRAECEQGRDIGMDGKTLIHPSQIETANAVFSPSPEEIALAYRQIAAYDSAVRNGSGIAVVEGRIVEALHAAAAHDLLARAALCKETT